MIVQTITLDEARNVTLTTYLLGRYEELHPSVKKPLVIVCPGGGYSNLSEREAEIIAVQYNAAGFHAAVLRYGIQEHAVMPGPICDLADAVAIMRTRAEEWNIDGNAIFVCGFSAGAHVAAGLSVFWNRPDVLGVHGQNPELIRPNGSILCYPVIDLHASTSHQDTGIQPGTTLEELSQNPQYPYMPAEKLYVFDEKENRYFVDFEVAMNAYIFGGAYTDEQEDFYSLHNQVSCDTPPAFLWHGGEDDLIDPINSLQYAQRLQALHIPYELHIFASGGHGLSLANPLTSNNSYEMSEICRPWMEMAIRFIDAQSHYSEQIKNQISGW